MRKTKSTTSVKKAAIDMISHSWKRSDRSKPLRHKVYGANDDELKKNLDFAIERGWKPISEPVRGLYSIFVIVERPGHTEGNEGIQ